MIVILTSVFTFLIIAMTAYFLIKVYGIAYNRKEITLRKLVIYSAATVMICLTIASAAPFLYQFLIDEAFPILK